MTVMCCFARRHISRGNTRYLASYMFQRHNSGLPDPHIPAFPQTYIVSQKHSSKNVSSSQRNKYQSYPDMLQIRREEAKRTILVEIEGLKDSAGVKTFCEKFGRVKKYYLYRALEKNFVLVEFENGNAKNSIMNSSFHSKDPQSIPVTSPFLYYYHSEKFSGSVLPDSTKDLQCNEKEILKELQNLQCNEKTRLQTEINHLHQKSQISDLSIRLRFFTCHQLDLALSGLFARVSALPFGSSLCGFGRNTGDLDIFLHFRKNLNVQNTTKKSQLYFLTKASIRDKNLQLKLIGDLISVMLPGCSGVMSILSARVPIIKYRHSFSNLECDVNNTAASGIDLTHILWLMNHWDSRVAPLVFAIRMWAQQTKICVKKPGPQLTNFGLTIMIIFFLQSQNILPSLHSLQNIKGASASLDSQSDLVFPDITRIPKTTSSTNVGVDTLLCNFFDFYSKFDFDKQKISIYHGKQIPKGIDKPLEIENPVDPSLNISQNVSRDGLKVFKKGLQDAISALGEDYESKSIKVIFPDAHLPQGVPLNELRPQSLKRKNTS
ncbi:Poly(A) RNA polymerase, mitochondrial [Frankliniella fusca]|uniref:Poly(A) RNA polymerase, mitochondrial n=1 Tax=Frankliniella fusca TaxID=407009 RepID=A0AAE1HUU9_9NEOP|nr:Poly(A) RNA polymerase, mitochondrial [Frankliniella fusca]